MKVTKGLLVNNGWYVDQLSVSLSGVEANRISGLIDFFKENNVFSVDEIGTTEWLYEGNAENVGLEHSGVRIFKDGSFIFYAYIKHGDGEKIESDYYSLKDFGYKKEDKKEDTIPFSTDFCLVAHYDNDGGTETLETFNNPDEVLFAYYKAKTSGKHYVQTEDLEQMPIDLKERNIVDVSIDVEIYDAVDSAARFDSIDNYVEYFI
jgi:hypothetical protein